MTFANKHSIWYCLFLVFAVQVTFSQNDSETSEAPHETSTATLDYNKGDVQLENSFVVNTEKPGARWGHVFIYYPDKKQLLLFGGARQRGGPYLNDTWIWHNGQWQQFDSPGPSARGFCAAAYHAKRGTIIVHGGRGDDRVTYSDLWEWDGYNWTQLEATSAYQADHHQMVYLDHRDILFAFGGYDGSDVTSHTWQWSENWEQLPVAGPPKRAAFGMAYDSKANHVILFGGLWINGQYADIWEWNGEHWSAISGHYDHSSLDHHALVYDQENNSIIGFGGKNYRYVPQGKTFSIAGDEIEFISSEGPAPRHSFGFTYDSHTNTTYLYGGKLYEKEENIPLDDLWKWNGKSWEQVE